MKIIGTGVDIINNNRLKLLIKKKNFINRIFSKKEIKIAKLSKNKIGYFSKRFAAKEALAKAIGTGFRKNLNFKDIEVANDKNGKPYYVKNDKIRKIILKKFGTNIFDFSLSISDEKDYSIAFTIIQSK
jgi:holo-[acyl-carrier protein] synthase